MGTRLATILYLRGRIRSVRSWWQLSGRRRAPRCILSVCKLAFMLYVPDKIALWLLGAGFAAYCLSAFGIPIERIYLLEFCHILRGVIWILLVGVMFRHELRLLSRFLKRQNTRVWPNLRKLVLCVLVLMLGNALLKMLMLSPTPSDVAVALKTDRLLTFGSVQCILTSSRAFVVVPIGEELLYRGAVFFTLLRLAGKWPAILISSLMFGCGHFHGSPGFTRSGWFPALTTSGFGLAASYLLIRTGKLRWCILFHAVWNLRSMVAEIWVGPLGIYI